KDLFTVFGYTVQTHAVVSVIAILLGFGVALTLTKKTIYQEHVRNYIFWALIGSIIGARLWHVFVFQWPYYMHHPAEIIAIWNGGISIMGAIVGGIVSLMLYVYKHKLDFWEFADYLAPPLVLGMGIGRVACFFGGDAFGSPTHLGFGVVFPEGTIAYDTYGSEPLWPVIIWESQGDIFIFAILLYLLGKKFFKGFIFTVYLFLYGVLRFVLEFFRGDSPDYAGLSGGQWTAIAFMVIALIIFVYLFIKQPKKKEEPIEE
ncbi:MAG: prolipoprotein diacylglyceryl transferase, partial [Tuberibacillus sp.]